MTPGMNMWGNALPSFAHLVESAAQERLSFHKPRERQHKSSKRCLSRKQPGQARHDVSATSNLILKEPLALDAGQGG